MAINFLDNVQFNQNQLLGARLQVESADTNVSGPESGQIIYNSTSNVFKYYNGTNWIDPAADTYNNWVLNGDNASTEDIISTAQVLFQGVGVTTTTSSASATSKKLSIVLDAATSTAKGGVELFSDTVQSVSANTVSTTASRTYGLQLNAAGQGVINVPWTDTSGMTSWTVTADAGGSVAVSDGQTLDFAGGSGIGTAYSTPSGAKTVTINNTKPFNSITLAASSGSNSTIFDSNTITLAAGAGITTTNNALGQVTIAATGAGTMSNWILAADSGQTSTIDDAETATMTGGTGIVTVTGTNSVSFATALDELPTLTPSGGQNDSLIYLQDGSNQGQAGVDSFPINEFGLPNGALSMNNKKITNLATPTTTTDAATKAYVDSVVVGNLVFQGGYDAANNTPDLDSSPSSSIKKGWAYVVTAAGSFFTETVEVGDFLIAQQDAPTTLANWVTVQNNIGLATNITPGIASFAVASFDVSAAGAVTLKNSGVTAATYGSASAVPVFAVNAKGQITSVTDTNISIAHTAITDFDTEVDARIAAREFAGNNSSAGTSHVFTHSLSSNDVMVQIVDTSTLETVFAKVDRTSTSAVTVTTASSISAGAIRALITKIG